MNNKQLIKKIAHVMILLFCVIHLTNYTLSNDIIYDFEYDLGEVVTLGVDDNNHLTSPEHTVTSANKNLEIINSPNATVVSYSELLKFIELDKTDEIKYAENEFVCGQYAEMFHNNAEEHGIETGVVNILFKLKYTQFYTGHAINVVNTTDKGMIFIDVSKGDLIIRELKVGSSIKHGNEILGRFLEVVRVGIYW